ncbi:MAG TPA: hypothetical protein VKV73_11515 [Chloroflexota bacterium]|nr:hypothetical protein [Chloroflexota bacterium]
MAVDAQPIEVKSVREEERLFGGDLVWWVFLLAVSVPGVLFGLALAPQIIGFLVLSVTSVAASVAFAQIALRLPFFTRRFLFSMLLVVLASAVIGGIAEIYILTLPVAQAPLDVMYKPPISGG